MFALNFIPFPDLITTRLKLRQLKIGDENQIMFLRTDERVNEFLNRKKPTMVNEAVDFIRKIEKAVANNESLYWAITMREKNALIGTICMFSIDVEKSVAEIGYELHPDFQGKGIMQEAIAAVIDFAFNRLQLVTLLAISHVANNNSIKLLERNNFQPDNNHQYLSQEDSSDLICYFLRHHNR